MWAWWLPNRFPLRGQQHFTQRFKTGDKSQVAHKWAGWLIKLCRLRVPNTSQRERNRQWPTIGPAGYITPAASGVSNDSERATKSEGAHN